MSQQVENALVEVDEAMHKLRDAYNDIRIRQDFLGLGYKTLTTAMARLTVEVGDNMAGFNTKD
ncbi:hypothetical protein L6E12_26110 [Actinokineospora sp. PR83]|uniref:hypothetical protein n=1 Tax=Actinokineospora sp. PR83 TaxID=2884908 RepID=UPI001F45444D|nr:hypothetical protein [Actinokineospora sp. PR83]MCG8919254.1 hypothetical protein [Actinokineospora sp. PR83]